MNCFRLVAFLLALIILTPGVMLSFEQKDCFVQALLETGAEPVVFDIVDWSVINREFMDFTGMERDREFILEIFDGIKQNLNTSKESDEMYRIINTEAIIDTDTILQIVQQSVMLPEEYEKSPLTYLVISITSRDMCKLTEMRSKAQEAIRFLGGESKITTCVTGTFNGKLNEVAQDEVLDIISERLKIENTEKTYDEYTIGIVGYSPLLSEGIKILDNIYNINIALRYNAEEDKTYIWMGTPVISIEH